MHSTASFSPLQTRLSRGILDVDLQRAALPPEALFGIAERRNPKRAFLFVSKVLGRHMPAQPSVMAASFERLADEIPPDLPGPVLVIGLAETAVGLGAGVHRSLSARRSDCLFLSTTRHPLDSELFTRFEEEHSHASRHLIHLPLDRAVRDAMLHARSLVLVDDEASTGNTFINLYRALIAAGLNNVERVVTCVLTDWSAGAVGAALGKSVTAVSLAEGRYRFTEDPHAASPEMPDVGAVSTGRWSPSADRDWGRLGVRQVADTLAPNIETTPGENILVLGTGEYVWRPFLLAERLERSGANVHFSATSRSPIALGHAITHALTFPDNYGIGIPNFLYNVAPGQFDRVLICTETPAAALSAELIETLNAEVIGDDL